MSFLSGSSLVLDQLYAFLEAFFQGCILAACFDFYRALRMYLFKRKKPVISVIADLFFWLLVTIIFIITIILRRWGDIHLYTYAGLILGCAAYFYLLSGFFFHLWLKVLHVAACVLERLFAWIAGAVGATAGHARKLKARIRKREPALLNSLWSRILNMWRRS